MKIILRTCSLLLLLISMLLTTKRAVQSDVSFIIVDDNRNIVSSPCTNWHVTYFDENGTAEIFVRCDWAILKCGF